MNSNALVCGQANVGIGKQFFNNGHYYSDPNCTIPGTAGQTQIDLPPVNQGDAATNNNNSRFFALDPVSGNKADVCWNGKLATGQSSSVCGSRQLFVDKNSAVTLGGSKYSFCKLTMRSNTALYIKAGTIATIYFDSPEACGLSSPALQLDMDSNSRITSTNGGAVNVRLMFVGSSTIQTKLLMSSNTSVRGSCEQNFIVYAPLSDIEMNSNSTFCGGLAGKSIHLDQNARVYTDSTVGTFVVPATAAHYVVSNFVECTGPAANPPSAGC
jgi:hypothetical protein